MSAHSASKTTEKIGILLANLGTPNEPTPKAIRQYLREFLSDPLVVDLPRWFWLPLLNGIILPKRSVAVAKKYQQIWAETGSPLWLHSLAQKEKLTQALQNEGVDAVIELAMTYGNPSVNQAMENLRQSAVSKIIVLPLFPQFSRTTTGAFFAKFSQALLQSHYIPPFEFIHSYYNEKSYITALCEKIKAEKKADHFLLFSFHGIPQRYATLGDKYPEQCRETAQLVAQQLGLNNEQWAISFQSRFGREPWLKPYTDDFLKALPQKNIRKIAIICPGFSVDCLETLEEIAVENKQLFLSHNGESYQYISALNSQDDHIKMMSKLILKKC